MKAKKILIYTFILFLVPQISLSWGAKGHYVIGLLAEQHLSKKTLQKVEKILMNESISGVGVWMDNIRSDKAYQYTNTWHWVTTSDGLYDPNIQEAAGDAFKAFNEIVANLKSKKLTPKQEHDQLRMLIHIVADLHQPLHVGKPGDRGGNDVKIIFMKKETNLHAIWDNDLIESKKMSYTEMTRELQKKISKEMVKKYKASQPADWLIEAVSYRNQIYDIPNNGKVGYKYIYDNYYIIEERLMAAGIRLAQVLEEIYGKK